MKAVIIAGISTILLILLIMFICTVEVKKRVINVFRCKRCLKLNRELKKTCEHCGNPMQSGLVYKSTFFGKRDCKNKVSNLDLSIMKKYINIDMLIWGLLILVAIALLVIVVICI